MSRNIECGNTPTGDMLLREHVAHVWKAWLESQVKAVPHFWQLLSPEETARADRFRFYKDHHRWRIARSMLRTLVGSYTQTAPPHLRFEFNGNGKPPLTSPLQWPSLQFNLSHSGDLALYAFARGRQVGIDVVHMRPTIGYDVIATRSFSPRERTTLLRLPSEQKHQTFYNCWTRKEAYLKARGIGLSLPLDLFDVSLLPDEPAALLSSREDSPEVERWSMREPAPGAGYVAALAVEGKDWQLQCWEWTKQG